MSIVTKVITDAYKSDINDSPLNNFFMSPGRITRSCLVRTVRVTVVIECIDGIDLSSKCTYEVALKITSTRESELKEENVLPLPQIVVKELSNGYEPDQEYFY